MNSKNRKDEKGTAKWEWSMRSCTACRLLIPFLFLNSGRPMHAKKIGKLKKNRNLLKSEILFRGKK